ncbi:hypothetical protein BASA50_006776 [Batrachochytrium salamandrivorans]|uniref:DNA-directed RNA polymerase subunit n=1 Tax=Batrachochytrium salamandrivorans TaxID=1357716 RepID=A0ABQ8F9J8_9FUNG|nr:hypothetical protein BASA62_001412 [Batrachochytrium salamandrivorans]KAH6580170.1 hypothetical protein BASA60_002987 [Batrachochytrium salamandrivorans]KAH6590532.1 hypothetical protein BASA61_005291 [Batrachochytrium salamandrivorans]KAH6594305.1 hypothetical protein BASA50_006776 [Batrachochytrium salamandrivorans]KAH9270013.1 hypothetical protein BASA83_007842 [Batrachochytrium salamandrivorans]
MSTNRPDQSQHSLVFCEECGSLLDPPTGAEDFVTCFCCGTMVNAKAFESRTVITVSKPSAFPDKPKPVTDASLSKKDGEDHTNAHLRDGATIREKCPKCDAPEMVFHTAQLRGADEGQTVFYSCIKCGYKYSMNS